jgi:Na+-transporting methylmalonyl-CoA/oxaloacetate decarboxylase gamma subunit
VPSAVRIVAVVRRGIVKVVKKAKREKKTTEKKKKKEKKKEEKRGHTCTSTAGIVNMSKSRTRIPTLEI